MVIRFKFYSPMNSLQEVRMMKSKNQAELRRLQRKLESQQRDNAGDD